MVFKKKSRPYTKRKNPFKGDTQGSIEKTGKDYSGVHWERTGIRFYVLTQILGTSTTNQKILRISTTSQKSFPKELFPINKSLSLKVVVHKNCFNGLNTSLIFYGDSNFNSSVRNEGCVNDTETIWSCNSYHACFFIWCITTQETKKLDNHQILHIKGITLLPIYLYVTLQL